MNASSSQFTTDIDGSTILDVFDLELAETAALQHEMRKRGISPEASAEEEETRKWVEVLLAQIRKDIGRVMAGRLEKGDRKKPLIHLGDTTTIVVAIIGDADGEEERNMLLAFVKPLVEMSIKSFISSLKHDPYEGDLYDKAFARIRAYLTVARNHSELNSVELITSPVIRAEYYRLVETPESWDGKLARAQRTLRAMSVSSVFDESLIPQLEGQLSPIEERQAKVSSAGRDAAKRVKLIYDIRKAEVWPKGA
jgi:hypothetical protein